MIVDDERTNERMNESKYFLVIMRHAHRYKKAHDEEDMASSIEIIENAHLCLQWH
jgi:hypothetical protein